MVRNMVREPPQNWSGDELVREQLVCDMEAAKTPELVRAMPRIGPGAALLTWFGGDVWERVGLGSQGIPTIIGPRNSENWSGSCPEDSTICPELVGSCPELNGLALDAPGRPQHATIEGGRPMP